MEDLSVIIPAYNASKTLATTLRSIVDQTVQPAEIIVIDDGSTDNTKDVVGGFRQVKYIQQNNSGVSAARNNGVALSNSTWIAFCDADDIWHPAKIDICRQAIWESDPIPFVFHDFYIFDALKVITESGTSTNETLFPIFLENRISIRDILRQRRTLDLCRKEYKAKKSVDILTGNAFEGLILGNFILPSTVLMKREVFLEIGGFNPAFRIAEETEFFLRASKTIDFSYIDLPLAGYRHASGGLTSNKARLLEHGLKAFELHCLNDQPARKNYSNNVNIGAAKRYSRMSYFYISECQRSDAKRYAINSLRYSIYERRAWLSLMLSMLPVSVLNQLRRAKALWTKRTY
jgi:glycosyltransferase involved in cell wall biosynthesis